jgi:hypothetical protein
MKFFLFMTLFLLSTTSKAQWVDFSTKSSGDSILLSDFSRNFHHLKDNLIVNVKGVLQISGINGLTLPDGGTLHWDNEIMDTHNAWDKGAAKFIMPIDRNGVVSISGSIYLTTSIKRFVSLHKLGIQFKSCSNRNSLENIVSFNCKLYLSGGESFTLSITGGGGVLRHDPVSEVYHHLLISHNN